VQDTASLERAASQTGKEDQLRFLLNVVARRWQWIALCAVLGAVGYGIVGLVLYDDTPMYTSQTQLILHEPVGQRVPGVATEPLFKNSPTALVDRIPVPDLAEDVVRAMVVEDIESGGPYGALTTDEEIGRATDVLLAHYGVNIQPIQGANKIAISAVGPGQDEVWRIVDLTARAFIARNRQMLVEQEQEIHQFVMREIENTREALDAAESAVWKYRKAMNFRTHDQVMADMEKMSADLIQSRKTRTELLARSDELQRRIREKQKELPKSLGTVNDSVMQKLFSELHDLHQQRLTLSVNWTGAYPPLRAIEDQIHDKEQAILQAYEELESGSGGSNVWQDRQNLRKQYMDVQMQLASLDIKETTYRKLIDEMEVQLPELADRNKEFVTLKHEAENLRNQYSRLIDKEFEVSGAIRRGAGYVERLTPVAAASLAPSQEVQGWMNFLIGGLVGLAAGLGLAMMWEKADSSIQTAEDVSQYLNLEVVGMIPMMHFGAKSKGKNRQRGNYVAVSDDHTMDACIVTQNDPKSPVSEAYRSLRTAFQLNTFTSQPKTLMVTSTVPGEGKTTTAVNMAVTFADSGMKVLVIDTDLRRPHAHHVLNLERGPGLADVLRDGLDPKSVIRKTAVENLYAISSGRVPSNPSELIGSDAMKDLMDKLGRQFDIVICDAPSLLVVTDPVVLSTGVDAVIMVVSVNNARRETILRGKKLLDTAKANVVGAVLNGLEATRRNYYYYYYYYDDASPARRRWYHFET
jgi:capsular exopolysaccharide synthesis family protein